MSKQTNRKEINKEIYMVSSYRALMIAKYSLSLILFLYMILATALTKVSSSPLYILLSIYFIPIVLVYFLNQLKSQRKTSDKKYNLPFLLKKYHFKQECYFTNSISFLFTCLLLGLWQYKTNTLYSVSLFSFLPTIILLINISIRVFFTIYYIFKIHHDYSSCNI